MNKILSIVFPLSMFFSLNINSMNNDYIADESTSLLCTTPREIVKMQKMILNKHNIFLPIPLSIIEVNNPNQLKRNYKNAFNIDFTNKSKKQRLENQNSIKTYICSHNGCNKAFGRKSNLTNHLKTHTAEQTYTCTYPGCNSSFNAKGNLTVHLRIHTGEKPFICTYAGCYQAFAAKSNLATHLRRHTGERPYLCTECNTFFRHSSALKTHLKTHKKQ